MKRIISIFMTLALIFSGCGVQSESNSESFASSQSSAMEVTPPMEDSSTAEDSSIAEDTPEENPPDNDWEIDTPENHGMDSDLLRQLHEVAKAVNIMSIAVVKDGYLVDEYYKEEYDENSVIRIASCTKSFSGALIGIAIDQGLIPDVDVKISQYFPQIAESDDEQKQEITLEHLLAQTSGLEWNEWNGGETRLHV